MRNARVLCLFIATSLIGHSSSAQYHFGQLQSLRPPVVQIGKPTDVRALGVDLVAVDQLHFSACGRSPKSQDQADGITATLKTQAAKPFAAEATQPEWAHFTVTASGAPRVCDVRAGGFNGLSNPLRLVLTDLPVQVLPDSSFTQEAAVEVPVPSWAVGTIRKSGRIYFEIDLDSKAPVIIDANARRIDSTSQLEIEVLDRPDEGGSARRLMRAQQSPDSEDPVLVFTPPAPGKYLVSVADNLFQGSSQAYFAIKIHRGPHVHWVQPPVVPAGKETSVTLFGVGLENADSVAPPWQSMPKTFTSPGELPTSVSEVTRSYEATSDRFDIATPSGRVSMCVTDLPVSQELEPNDTFEHASEIAIDSEIAGVFGVGRDTDWYRFEAKKDESFDITVFAHQLGQECDPILGVFHLDDPTGNKILRQSAMIDDHKDREARRSDPFRRATVDPNTTFKAAQDGVYLIRIRDQFNVRQEYPPLQYRLSLRRLTPRFRVFAIGKQLRVDNGNQVFPFSLALRKGETRGLRLEVDRIGGFGGELTVAARTLPPGIIAPAALVPVGTTSATMMFTAGEDAAFDAVPIELVASAKLGDAPVDVDVVPLVCTGGSNDIRNAAASTRVANSLVLSIAGDAAHASLSVEYPDAPPKLKPEGKHKIKMSLVRRHDFKAALKFKALGLGKSWKVGEAQLDEKTATAEYEISVPKDAKPGKYVFYLKSDATVKVNPNKPLHDRAVAYRKHLDTVEADAKKARAAEKDAEKQKAIDGKLQQIAAAKKNADNDVKNLAKTVDRKLFVQSQPMTIEVVAK